MCVCLAMPRPWRGLFLFVFWLDTRILLSSLCEYTHTHTHTHTHKHPHTPTPTHGYIEPNSTAEVQAKSASRICRNACQPRIHWLCWNRIETCKPWCHRIACCNLHRHRYQKTPLSIPWTNEWSFKSLFPTTLRCWELETIETGNQNFAQYVLCQEQVYVGYEIVGRLGKETLNWHPSTRHVTNPTTTLLLSLQNKSRTFSRMQWDVGTRAKRAIFLSIILKKASIYFSTRHSTKSDYSKFHRDTPAYTQTLTYTT